MTYEVQLTAEDMVPPSYALVDTDTEEVLATIECVHDDWEVNLPDRGTPEKTLEAFDSLDEAKAWALSNAEKIRQKA